MDLEFVETKNFVALFKCINVSNINHTEDSLCLEFEEKSN